MEKYKRRRTETRACEYCGRTFEAPTVRSRFCSNACRHRQYNEQKHPDWYRKVEGIKTCPMCGKRFETENRRKIFCSRKCKDKNSARTSRTPEQERERYKRMMAALGKEYKSREEIAQEAEQKKQEKERDKAKRLAITYTCVVCGREYHTLNTNQKTCSSECSKRYTNIRRDHRIKKENVIDRNITLASLFRRDKGTCYICGMACDYNDFQVRNGQKIIGNMYPTIDHVIPIARGGLHEWANVKLAHRICNSIKSADADPEKVKAYRKASGDKEPKEPKDPRKAIRQIRPDGTIVAEYKSTAEAEKETGFKQRQIQNCARGETKTYRGFRWIYL